MAAPARGQRACSDPRSWCARPSSSTPAFDARRSAQWRDVPLHDREPAGARPVPRPVRVVGARAARPARAAARRRPVPRRARLRVVLPQGPARARRRCGACSSRAGVDDGDGVLRYEIRATAFCWQMVRSIVGTLVDVGVGQAPARRDPRHPARRAIATAAGRLAPPRACASGKSATDRTSERLSVAWHARRLRMAVTRSGYRRRGEAALEREAHRATRDMYADEVDGGALFRGLAEYADAPTRRVPHTRRRGGTSRRALGAAPARVRRRAAHARARRSACGRCASSPASSAPRRCCR